MRLLWSVDHALQRTSKRMDRSLGVTGPQRLVIRVVGSHPGLSAGDVARILRIHPSTLTGILKRLEQRKIIRRVADPADGRRAFLHLNGLGRRSTPRGRARSRRPWSGPWPGCRRRGSRGQEGPRGPGEGAGEGAAGGGGGPARRSRAPPATQRA
jgi:DNA-binding MarR family transcriptional regulator